MTTTVDDDFREFVAARWPELESVALVVLLDPDRARAVTADALAGMSRRWRDALDAGRPGEQARATVLRAALTAATPGNDSTNRSHLPRTRPGEDVTYWSNVPQDERNGTGGDQLDPDDQVVAALVAAIHRATPIERAVLAGTVVWGCSPDEVAHLLDQPRDSVGEHTASLESRLTASHDAARATHGLGPSPWSRDRDIEAAVDEILRELSDPPDPAALVTERATGLRRRTLLTGGAAALALTATGAALVRRATTNPTDPSTSAGRAVEKLAPDDPRWASVPQWPARGSLAGDPAVAALVVRDGSPRDRVLWAGDLETQRVVISLAYTDEDTTGGALEGGEPPSEPMVRAHQGPVGIDPARLEMVPFMIPGTVDTNEAVAVILPGGQEVGQRQSLLVVLARPTLRSASVSHVVRPQADGTSERTWSPLTLENGVAVTTLDTATPIATWVRVGAWEGPPSSFVESYTMLSDGPAPSTSPGWAQAHISALTGMPERDLSSTVFHDEEVPRALFEWPPPPDAVPARLVSILTTTPDGAVLRTTALHGDGFVWPVEPSLVFTAATQRDPLVVWAADEREGVARFVVGAPGADQVQLISSSPDGYPASTVVPTRGRAAVIVPVVDGGHAGEYRVVAKDAKGRVLFDGVPSAGRFIFDP